MERRHKKNKSADAAQGFISSFLAQQNVSYEHLETALREAQASEDLYTSASTWDAGPSPTPPKKKELGEGFRPLEISSCGPSLTCSK